MHTTEGDARGSGEKLAKRGEAHYMIDTAGRVYGIISRSRVAYHCGRSMWNGQTSLDNCSVGIEVVGYHNKPLTRHQIASLKSLLAELKRIYRIPDNRVLPHSMVAYGAPNRWHSRSHRGRKRCGMQMGTASLRAKLGLYKKPDSDPDVDAGRLIVADQDLRRVLYGKENVAEINRIAQSSNIIDPRHSAWDIARDAYNSASTIYVFPDGTRKNGTQILNWKTMPSGTMVIVTADDSEEPEKMSQISATGSAIKEQLRVLAGDEWNSAKTIYIKPNGSYVQGDDLQPQAIASLPKDTRVFVGYKIGGPITARQPAFEICGSLWKSADTYYLLPSGKIESGASVDPKKIPKNTMVIFKD